MDMNFPSVLLLLAILAAFVLAVRRLIKGRREGRHSCSGSCGGCPMSGSCGKSGSGSDV